MRKLNTLRLEEKENPANKTAAKKPTEGKEEKWEPGATHSILADNSDATGRASNWK